MPPHRSQTAATSSHPREGEFKTFVKKMLAVPKAEVDRRHAEKRKGKKKDRY